MAFVVYSFGEFDFWNYVLSAVKNLIGSDDFQAIAASALAIGVVWKLLSMQRQPEGKEVVSLFTVVLVLTGMLKGSVDVVVRDEILNRDSSIRNVPIVVALPAFLVTNLERGLTQLFETYFSLPDGVRYIDFGYDIEDPLFRNSFSFTVKNAFYDRSWTNFIKDCVIPSVSQRRINANDLINGSNLESVLDNVNPAYTTEYCDLSGSCQVVYCDQAWNNLKRDTATLLPTFESDYVGKVLSEKGIYTSETALRLKSDFYNIADYFLNYGVTLQEYVKQALLVKQFSKGVAGSAGYYGATDDLIARYMVEVSKPKINQTLLALGELAGSYVPLIKKVLLILFIGSTPIIFLLLYIDFLRTKALMSYFTVLISLTLWDPLFSILNLIIGLVNQNHLGVCSIGTGHLSMVYFSCLTSASTTMEAVAGAAAWAVPTIALGLASGSAYALVSGLTSITGRISGGINASVASPEGAISTGRSYAALEESKRLGENYANIAKAETISYTQATAAKLFALRNNPDYFFQKGNIDMAEGQAKIDAFGNDPSLAYEKKLFDTKKDIGRYKADKVLGPPEALGKGEEARKTDLVSTAYNQPSRFVKLVEGTRAVDVIRNLMDNLPFSISESDLRATGVGATIDILGLQKLLGGTFKGLTPQRFRNLLEKASKDFKGASDLIGSVLSGSYSISGKSQHQIAADLKRLAGILLYEQLKEEGGIDKNGVITKEGAETLRNFVESLIKPYDKLKPQETLQETSKLTSNHSLRALEEFGNEGVESLKNPLFDATMLGTGLGLYQGLKEMQNRFTEPNKSLESRRRRHRKISRTISEEENSKFQAETTPTEEKKPLRRFPNPSEKIEERIPRGAREAVRGIVEELPSGEIATSFAGRALRFGLRAGTVAGVFYPQELAGPTIDEYSVSGKVLKTIGGEPKPNSLIGLEVETDNGKFFLPALIDSKGNVYNYAALKALGVGYSFESGKFFRLDNYKLVNDPLLEPRLGTLKDLKEGKLEINTRQYWDGFLFPANDKGANELLKFLREGKN